MAQNDYCVIGMGRFGGEVAKYLHSKGKKVLIIDNNEKVMSRFQHDFNRTVIADATSINILQELGVAKANTVIVCVSNVETSATICSNLKELGVKHIIARAKNALHKKILTVLGVEYSVIPENIVGRQLGFRAIYSVETDVVNINEKVILLNLIVTNDEVDNKPIETLNLRGVGINVITINRGNEIIFPISAQTRLYFGDDICVVCPAEKLNEIAKFFSKAKH